MVAYISYLLLAGTQALFFYRGGKLRKDNFNAKGFLALCCIELIFLAGFRGYTIGADTEAYLNAIDYYGGMSTPQLLSAKLVYPFNFEIGYFLFTKLCCLLGVGKTGFLFIIAAISYIPIFSLIRRYSSGAYVSVLCYFAFGFFSYSLGIFRQMIAISILICGCNYIMERKFIKYLAVVILAMTFHTTAIVAILLYFLYGIKWQRVIPWCIPLECGLLVFGRSVVVLLIRIFPRYAHYIGGRFDVQGGTYLMLIFLNIVFIASIIFRSKEDDKCENMTLCALFLAICLQCMGYSFGIFGRAVSYFSIYMIIAIPNLIYNVRKGLDYEFRGVVSLITILCLFVLTFLSFDGNKYVVPYYTIWG